MQFIKLKVRDVDPDSFGSVSRDKEWSTETAEKRPKEHTEGEHHHRHSPDES